MKIGDLTEAFLHREAVSRLCRYSWWGLNRFAMMAFGYHIGTRLHDGTFQEILVLGISVIALGLFLFNGEAKDIENPIVKAVDIHHEFVERLILHLLIALAVMISSLYYFSTSPVMSTLLFAWAANMTLDVYSGWLQLKERNRLVAGGYLKDPRRWSHAV